MHSNGSSSQLMLKLKTVLQAAASQRMLLVKGAKCTFACVFDLRTSQAFESIYVQYFSFILSQIMDTETKVYTSDH